MPIVSNAQLRHAINNGNIYYFSEFLKTHTTIDQNILHLLKQSKKSKQDLRYTYMLDLYQSKRNNRFYYILGASIFISIASMVTLDLIFTGHIIDQLYTHSTNLKNMSLIGSFFSSMNSFIDFYRNPSSISFLCNSVSLGFNASAYYLLFYAAASTLTIGILFVSASVTNLIKSGIQYHQINNIIKNKPLSPEQKIYFHHKKRCAKIDVMTSVLGIGIMAAWCFCPPSIILSATAIFCLIATQVIAHQFKKNSLKNHALQTMGLYSTHINNDYHTEKTEKQDLATRYV